MNWIRIDASGPQFHVCFRRNEDDYPGDDDEFKTTSYLYASALSQALEASSPVLWRQSELLANVIINALCKKDGTVKQVAAAEEAFYLAAEKLSEDWRKYDAGLCDLIKPAPEAQEQGAPDE